MMTAEQLIEHIGRRPFKPFRIRLTTGEAVDVTRVAQAVATKSRLVYAPDSDDCFRWIPMHEVDRVEAFDLKTS